MPGPGAGVDAGDVAQGVDPGRPGGEERDRRLPAVPLGDVEALEVVPQRALLHDAERLGCCHGAGRLAAGLAAGGAVGAGVAGPGVDGPVVAVPREARVAGGLRAQGDRQQPPAQALLLRDPPGGEVRLGPAAAAVTRDVDADGEERRGAQPGVHRLLGRRHALVETVAGEVPRSRHVVRVRAHRHGEHGRSQQPGQVLTSDRGMARNMTTPGEGGSRTITSPVTPATCVSMNYSTGILARARRDVRGVVSREVGTEV